MKRGMAVIDIGTNSVLLTIAVLSEKCGPKVVVEKAEITRLGEGLIHSGKFSAVAVRRTLLVLKKYQRICQKHGTETIITVATEAARKAKNAASFIKRAEKVIGEKVEVISGKREAELAFRAASQDFGKKIAVIDIGGGSTEIISGPNKMKSLPIGSVVLTEKFVHSDPISNNDYESLHKFICKCLEKHMISCSRLRSNNILYSSSGVEKNISLVATAGTAATLGAMHLGLKKYDGAKVHGLVLKKRDIEVLISRLRALPLVKRKSLAGLQPKRADVILAGAMILDTVMEKMKLDEVTISDRGVRWGLIFELQNNRRSKLFRK